MRQQNSHQARTEAVRTAVARVATHPALIEIAIRDGTAHLSGPVFDYEVQSLLETARRVPGVRAVNHKFNILFASPDARAHHKPENQFVYPLRALEWISGALLLAQGFRKRDALGILSSAIGMLMVARAVSNRNLPSLMKMRRTIYVSASMEDVYDFWARFENYPRFMSFIRDVSVSDTGNLRWTARAPGGAQIQWDTTILDLTPHQRIAWKSAPGSLITTEGIIAFKSTEPDGVEIDIELSYSPPAGALGYAIAHIMGFDPSERIDDDLEIMKLLIEQQARTLSYG